MRECPILLWQRQQTWGDHRRCRVWQVPCRSTTQARWSSCYCWTTSKEFEVVKGEQQTTVWVLHQEWAKEARLKKKDARLVHGKLLTPHWVNRIYWAETRQETRVWSLSNSMMNLKTVLTSGDWKLGQVDIRKYTFKLFLVILAVYNSYVGTEWLFTHHNKCRQRVSTDRGRKRGGFIGIEEL